MTDRRYQRKNACRYDATKIRWIHCEHRKHCDATADVEDEPKRMEEEKKKCRRQQRSGDGEHCREQKIEAHQPIGERYEQ